MTAAEHVAATTHNRGRRCQPARLRTLRRLLRLSSKGGVIHIRAANAAPPEAPAGVPWLGLLRQRGCRFHLEGGDDDLYFLVSTGNGGYLRVPLVAAGRLFLFYIRDAPEVASSTAAAAAPAVTVIAALRSHPTPAAEFAPLQGASRRCRATSC